MKKKIAHKKRNNYIIIIVKRKPSYQRSLKTGKAANGSGEEAGGGKEERREMRSSARGAASLCHCSSLSRGWQLSSSVYIALCLRLTVKACCLREETCMLFSSSISLYVAQWHEREGEGRSREEAVQHFSVLLISSLFSLCLPGCAVWLWKLSHDYYLIAFCHTKWEEENI